jgi:hypothetical protein
VSRAMLVPGQPLREHPGDDRRGPGSGSTRRARRPHAARAGRDAELNRRRVLAASWPR